MNVVFCSNLFAADACCVLNLIVYVIQSLICTCITVCKIFFLLLIECFFYSAAKLALQALYVLWQIHLSVCPSVSHHTPVLCQNEGIQRDPVFTVR